MREILQRLREARAVSDITGQVFGKLTAMNPTDKRSGRNVVWHCKCECGNEIDVSVTHLKGGSRVSCGCERSVVKVGDRYGRLVVKQKMPEKSNGQGLLWKCTCDCGEEVETRSNYLLAGHKQSCGCLATETKSKTGKSHVKDAHSHKREKEWVDGTSLDMIKVGGKPNRNTTSGYKGVSFHKQKGRWQAYLNIAGKMINLGFYDTPEEAYQARLEGEKKYYEPVLNKHGR